MPSPETESVLSANAAFYRAFARRDLEAMDELWATGSPVACIHPGWDALRTREDVMESWGKILANPESPSVEYSDATASLLGQTAFVITTEVIQGSELIATNVFVREGGEWKMVHHHAGPLAGRRAPRKPKRSPPPPPRILN